MKNSVNDIPIDNFDLTQLLRIFWASKYLIISITFISALTSLIYALSLPNIYSSQALLMPISQKDSPQSSLNSYSSVASLVGINIPAGSGTKTQEAIERIKSFEFFSKNFLPYIQKENLLAATEWLPVQNIILYDEDLFDIKNKEWIREVSYPKQTVPSDQELFKIYKEKLKITEDLTTSFVTINMEHVSPFIAQKWIEVIVKQVNDNMRENDKKNAQNFINYLNSVTTSSNIQSIQSAISSLIEDQMKILMLTSSNDDYVFKFIDSPIATEEKSSPNRAMICIIGSIFGGLLSLIISMISNYRKFINV